MLGRRLNGFPRVSLNDRTYSILNDLVTYSIGQSQSYKTVFALRRPPIVVPAPAVGIESGVARLLSFSLSVNRGSENRVCLSMSPRETDILKVASTKRSRE